jgi:hypothetical protein
MHIYIMFSSNKDNQPTFSNDQDLDERKKTIKPIKPINNNTLSRSSFHNDNGNDIFVLCSYYGCNTKYKINKFPPLTPVVAPMNEDEKFWAILESITQTKLFCMQHCLQHATTICANSKIVYEE